MQCPKCRAAMPNGAKYCTECGAKLPVQPDSVPNVPQLTVQEAPAASARPVVTDAPPTAAQGPRLAPQDAPVKMKWFKFLIYFALWAGGILSILSSFNYLTGTILGVDSDAELIYAYYPLLRALHMFCGLECIAYGAFVIYTRYRLAQFRRNGPACLYALYVSQFAVLLLVQCVTSLILGEWVEGYSFLGNALSYGIFLAINVSYFRKRKYLFIN